MTKAKPDDKTSQLHRIYASGSPEETAAIYDNWAADYEGHMAGAGYAHPAMVAAMLARHQPAGDAPVLDAGAGTGIMGELLTALGYAPIDGIDASEGMLARAAEREVYRELRCGLLGTPLDYADDAFAAVVAAGVFTEGHAPLDGLDELVRATRPGGHIVFSIARSYLGETFAAKGRALEAAGKWRRVDASARYDSTPLSDDVLTAQVFAFAVV
ncbi:MAG: methyltransferase domain-containing protein [Rhodospirillales bacterium]|nr:MAG: methyltransferase domain-containing protein [Rhodospirillales bacterium]